MFFTKLFKIMCLTFKNFKLQYFNQITAIFGGQKCEIHPNEVLRINSGLESIKKKNDKKK